MGKKDASRPGEVESASLASRLRECERKCENLCVALEDANDLAEKYAADICGMEKRNRQLEVSCTRLTGCLKEATHDRQLLERTTELLQDHMEQLQIANEQLQSANEEIQASSEALEQANERLRRSEEQYRTLVEGSLMGIVIERSGKPLFANQAFAQIFGFEGPQEIIATGVLKHLCAPHGLWRLSPSGKAPSDEAGATEPLVFQGLKKDGSSIWVETQARSIRWEGEAAVELLVSDITPRKLYEEQLQRQANFDDLTGLPNRTLLLDRLQRAIVGARRRDYRVGVLFVDLDHFKKINDTFGHVAGDQFLRQAAEKIVGCVREADTVGRISGDEFVVVLPDIHVAEDVEPVVRKILNSFSRPSFVQGHEAYVTASIGLTIWPDDNNHDSNQLLRNADLAMYRAKQKGRNTFHFFTPELNRHAQERVRLEGLLRQALQDEELALHYQPIVEINSGNVVGAEALLRWQSPELGCISPDTFVPLAEETGLIVPLGEWVFKTACREFRIWHNALTTPVRLSINVSSRQLRGSNSVNFFRRLAVADGFPPVTVDLEITERLLMDDTPEVREALNELTLLGFRISLDDFGTGYSALSYVKKFPLSKLKIDKSFISGIPADKESVALVEAIIAMAHRLKLQVVAEGVETKEQLEFLRTLGCEFAQGYYFAQALTAADFHHFVRTWQQRVQQAV